MLLSSRLSCSKSAGNLECPKCHQRFRTKAQKTKHVNKVHRRDYQTYKHFFVPIKVPDGAENLRIVKSFPRGLRAPNGYRQEDLPLLVASFEHNGESFDNVFVDYEHFKQDKERSKMLCYYFLGRVNLVERPKDAPKFIKYLL